MQTVKTTITMDANGRLTIAAEVRAALEIEGAVLLELEVSDHALILRPGVTIPEEDLWAYTPEHIERIERARRRSPDEDFRLTPEALEQLTPERLQQLLSRAPA